MLETAALSKTRPPLIRQLPGGASAIDSRLTSVHQFVGHCFGGGCARGIIWRATFRLIQWKTQCYESHFVRMPGTVA